MAGREAGIKDRILNTLRAAGAYAEKTHGEAMQARGMPDIHASIAGSFAGIEVKQPGEVPSPLQAYHLQQIRQSGGWGVFVSKVRTVERALLHWPEVCMHCFEPTEAVPEQGCCHALERRCEACRRGNQ